MLADNETLMTIYAISALNGNFPAFNKLLNDIAFDREKDQLWFSGNIVNGGADSLETLRFVKELGSKAIVVLGHQELRLLAIAEGMTEQQQDDRFNDILVAEDREELLKWLYRRPLLHHAVGYTLVHAGIPAEWSLSQARTFAIEAESSLAMGNHKTFFENILVDSPTRWHAKLRGWKRLRFIINAFTRMTYCDENDRFDFSISDTAREPSGSYFPWARQSNRAMLAHTIICGNVQGVVEEGIQGIIPLHSNATAINLISAMRLTA